jgi:high-affinity iron transporter
VNWADSVPNLLIGLREGLEAGLVVSILLAAVRKIAPPAPHAAETDGTAGLGSTAGLASTAKRISTAPVWLGVLGAIMLSGSFAAVLTYSTDVLSSKGQEAVGGLLSVLAVGLVTWMIFWMRRTARTLSAHLREEVARAALIGAGALTITAFLAVGREGLETTLFLWTAAKASGQTVAPLAGAAIGIAAAVGLCWLLYRQAVRLNIGVFFSRTAFALIVIAAGVLAYGLGDLQDAGMLPGHSWIAFDLTTHIDPGSWWASIITGLTNLSPKMTVLQAVAWVGYLVVVTWAFINAGRAPAAAPAPAQAPAGAGRWEQLAGTRTWAVAGVLVTVPALAVGTAIAALPARGSASPTVTVTDTGCGKDWTSASAGAQVFTVRNSSGKSGEVALVNAGGGIVGEIETIGPATSAPLSATLTAGTYSFQCAMSGSAAPMRSAPVQVTGTTSQAPVVAVRPVTLADLTPPNKLYQAYAAGALARLTAEVTRIQGDLKRGDIAAAKTDWLAAQLDWERVGASYDSFGDLGVAVDGLPDGLPDGVADKDFTGLHRLEYGLYHGQSATELLPVAGTLAADIAKVRKNLTSGDLAGDAANLPLRAHEILEDALRDHLSGVDDQGAGTAYPMTYADVQATQAVLSELGPLISSRQPGLVASVSGQAAALRKALLATRAGDQWRPAGQVSLTQRQAVNASIGALLETLSDIPTLLEIRPAG